MLSDLYPADRSSGSQQKFAESMAAYAPYLYTREKFKEEAETMRYSPGFGVDKLNVVCPWRCNRGLSGYFVP